MAERRPVVDINGNYEELPIGDTLPGGSSGLMPYRIESGDQLVISNGLALIACGALEIIGGITLNGRICL